MPPCWEGITPGISSADQVTDTLEQLTGSKLLMSFGCSGRGCAADLDASPCMAVVLVGFSDNRTVQYIWGDIGFDFDARSLLNLIGAPNSVYPAPYEGACSHCDRQPNPRYGDNFSSSYLLYPELGAYFTVATSTGCVCPESRLTSFVYFEPMSTAQALELLIEIGKVEEDQEFVDWYGFSVH